MERAGLVCWAMRAEGGEGRGRIREESGPCARESGWHAGRRELGQRAEVAAWAGSRGWKWARERGGSWAAGEGKRGLRAGLVWVLGLRKKGSGPAGWASNWVWVWFLPLFFFLIQTKLILFEIKFKIEFNTNTKTNKRDAPA